MTTTASDSTRPDYRGREVWGAFIGGSFVEHDDAETFAVEDPATGQLIARVVSGGPELVDLAVRDARRAFESWRETPPRERGRLMRLVAERIRANVEELAELEAREVGKPRRDALRFDVSFSHAAFDYFAGLAETLHGEILDQGPIEARVVYEPYGVVAAILPFNWPPIHFAKKCAPALAAGNVVVVKPGEQAPLTVLRLVELANHVLPPGVINAVAGIDAGPALAMHPQVERITFTGATATGQRVLRSAAENLTFATMELGGKNALIVLPDADLDVAIDVALEGMFYNQGEACTSTARILVHDSIHDEFLDRFARATEGATQQSTASRRYGLVGGVAVGVGWLVGLAPPSDLKGWVFFPLLVALLGPALVAIVAAQRADDSGTGILAALWSGLVGGLGVFIVWMVVTYSSNGGPYDAGLVADFHKSGAPDLATYTVSDNLGSGLVLLVTIPTVGLALGSLGARIHGPARPEPRARIPRTSGKDEASVLQHESGSTAAGRPAVE